MSELKPYMAYSRGAGPAEGAMLVLAPNSREAKKMAWPVLLDWGTEEYTDLTVRLLHEGSHVLALADQAKLAAGEPHVVDSPQVCDALADGRCSCCNEYAGDMLVGLYRDYEARQAVTQEAA